MEHIPTLRDACKYYTDDLWEQVPAAQKPILKWRMDSVRKAVKNGEMTWKETRSFERNMLRDPEFISGQEAWTWHVSSKLTQLTDIESFMAFMSKHHHIDDKLQHGLTDDLMSHDGRTVQAPGVRPAFCKALILAWVNPATGPDRTEVSWSKLPMPVRDAFMKAGLGQLVPHPKAATVGVPKYEVWKYSAQGLEVPELPGNNSD